MHLLAAQRELLLAISATIEHHRRGQRQEAEGRPQRRRPTKVELE